MLLEAGEQALREGRCYERDFDRTNTAVVVGSIFGGDFGNALFAGLRLPELKHHLIELLRERGVTKDLAAVIAQSYEEKFLKINPALLDETGSFTSSTLASRLSKTFDLMGGALAIDCGDVSSFAALQAATQLLQSRAVNQVLCAAAHRSLDTVGIETLARHGCLPGTNVEGQPGYYVGEGVAVVLLKRLSDAQRDGDKIITTIDGIAAGFDSRSSGLSLRSALDKLTIQPTGGLRLIGGTGFSSVTLDGARHLTGANVTQSPLIPITGHLQATQGLADLIVSTVESSSTASNVATPVHPVVLTGVTVSGQSYAVSLAQVEMLGRSTQHVTSTAGQHATPPYSPMQARPSVPNAPAVQPPSNKQLTTAPASTSSINQVPTPVIQKTLSAAPGSAVGASKLWRFAANDLATLQSNLAAFASESAAQIQARCLSRFESKGVWRAAIVCEPQALSNKLTLASKQVGAVSARVPLTEQGIFWAAPNEHAERVAWLFPGQGSQYRGMLDELIAFDPAARRALELANALLAEMHQPSFDEIAGHAAENLGEDVWLTLAAMLVADWVMMESLRARGYQPSLVSGHSYGEFAAMLAAGCWDLSGALHATWHRCRAIVEHVPAGFGMLSIQANAERVHELLQIEPMGLSISHINAAQQVVVGGRHAAVVEFAQMLDDAGIGSRVLAVPTAFHTPALAPAQQHFARALQSIDIAPPVVPLLSSVTNRYEADPDQLAANLVHQLVHPIDFLSLSHRLLRDRVGLAVEVGPQQVLTRLLRQNVGDALPVIACDQPKRSGLHQLLCAEAHLELFSDPAKPSSHRATAVVTAPTKLAPQPLLTFDATQRRRERMRSGGRVQPSVPAAPVQPTAATANTTLRQPAQDATANAWSPVQPPVQNPAPVVHPIAPTVPPASYAPSPFGSHSPSASSAAQSSAIPSDSVPPEKPSDAPRPTLKFIETFLIDFVVEQTGYPAEIIELDWDIEADLGIDSIKKAQLFGELREFFDFESLQDFSLDNFRTLRDIATLLERTPGKSDWLEQVANDSQADRRDESPASSPSSLQQAPPEPTAADSYNLPSSSAVPPALTELSSSVGTYYDSAETETSSDSASAKSNQLAMSESQLTQFLIDFVVEQTGYPPEIVELDADLEADLGIDSIKKAQLFGELREMFQFSAQPAAGNASSDPAARQSLADYRTLRTVLNAMLGTAASASTPSSVIEPTQAKLTSATTPIESPVAAEVHPTETRSAPLQNAVAIGTRAWPLLNHAEQIVTPEYQSALESNLRALIGRRGHAANASIADDAVTIQTDVLRIAELCHTNGASLQRLDTALLTQLNWNSDAHGAIAELTAPHWLASAGGDLAGLKIDRSGELISIAPAGSAHATALVHRFTLLCVGGVLNESQSTSDKLCVARQQIAQWIATVPANLSYDECVRELSKVRIAGDWWIKVVDAKTRRFALAESRGGVTAVQFGQVSEPMSNGHVYPLPVVSICLDRNADRFTIRHVGDALRGCCEALELNEAWIAKNTSAAQVVNHRDASTNIATRYELQMSPAPQRNAPSRQPEWSGAAMVIGDNPVAQQLEARLRNVGVSVTRVAASEDPHALASRLAELSQTQLVKHLFIATPCDADAAISLDERSWRVRRNKGIMGIFWLCQRWLNQVIAAGCTDESSLVAISSQGGDFGFSGNLHSAEGGGVGGLLKSILIEGWMKGIRTMPIKLIDTAPQQSPAEIVDCVWRELAVPSYDLEVSYMRGIRHVVRAVPRPIASVSRPVPHGGTWVCTGGARGITAFVTEELAKRYGLKLHLLGTAPAPQFDPAWRDLDEDGMRRLKASVMTNAREAGQNPIKTWQNTEKALEIDATLRRFASLGIEAHYHCCDVANRAELRKTLENVRRISGPIQGVLHGAGVGKDARFDRKQAEKVDQCIAAKVDGSLALMDATQSDPLRYFVGFGSISGRFGANGHTDYSLSNEMLCKQIDWFKRQRPDVKAVGFHWHAWGDVGMATKPETRLALEMIDMQFMPAREGMEHLIAELESDSTATEVLITDDRYYRAFYPAETLVASDLRSSGQPVGTPMLVERTSASGVSGVREFVAKVDPSRDPFLTDHKLDGHPLLPFVIASEMLMEAAAACCGSHEKVVLQDVEALQGLRFFSPGARELTVYCHANSSNAMQLGLQCDFLARDGRLVEANRLHFRAKASLATRPGDAVRLVAPENAQWVRAIYPPIGEKFYVGWPFQRLRKVALTEEGLIGKIAAPALIELAGTGRDLRGWQIPCAAMDSCLFAVGALAWQRVAPGTALPIRFGRLEVGRLPSPGEACEVHVRLLSHSSDRASFDFTLYGVDGDVLLNACDYEVAWLQVSSASDAAMHAGRGASQ